MNKLHKLIGTLGLVIFILTGCTNLKKDSNYDFDHQLQFKQQKSESGGFHIQVNATRNTSFEQLSSFLFRHAYKLCGSYGFTMEVLNGVEGVDDREISPSYIQPSLIANLTCPTH